MQIKSVNDITDRKKKRYSIEGVKVIERDELYSLRGRKKKNLHDNLNEHS